MELWVRSQDKKRLIKASDIYLDETLEYNDKKYAIKCETIDIGYYTFNRALEVLDEIQNQIKTLLYLKPKKYLKSDMIKSAKYYFEEMNNIGLVATDSNFEIEPITTNAIVYEMPKE